MYHIGIVVATNPYKVCHSANSRDNGKTDTFSTLADLAKTWQYAGTLKNTADIAANSNTAEAISLLNQAIDILTK